MLRPILTLLSAAALTTAALAQAPIERPAYRNNPNGNAAANMPAPNTRVLNPIAGVQVLTDTQLQTVSSSASRIELRLDRGRANVSVNHPAPGTLILIDLPGGQADLLKDGFYTLNADTNTLAVLHGEAMAYPPNAPPDAEGKKVSEMQGAVLGQHIHPDDLYETQAQADVLPAPGQPGGYGQGAQAPAYAGNNDGGYGDPQYASGYYDDDDGYYAGYAYPAGYAYGYGYGYPYYAGYGYYGGYYPWGWNVAWGYPYWYGAGWGGYYGRGYYGGYYGRGYYGGRYYGRSGVYGYGNPIHHGTGYNNGGYRGGSGFHPAGPSGGSRSFSGGSYGGGARSFSAGGSHFGGGGASHAGGHR